jgi:hypothetical protein
MLGTFLSVGSFHHIAYSLVIMDCEKIYDERLDRETNSGVEFHNFLAVHLLEDLDIFDYENSVYERSENNPNVIKSNIKKVVLREPKEGFPPLFRVVNLKTRLYVSAEARTALESAGIRGIDFIQVENDYTVVSALP